MSLVMYRKDDLSPAQLAEIAARLALPIHAHDEGPSRAWATYKSGLHAFFDDSIGRLIALVEYGEGTSVRPGWWIDHEFRGRGYGRQVVELLAKHLRANGVTHIGRVLIASHQQQYDVQSTRMVQRLRRLVESPPS
jgi:RimJ/RimL family protein N-acetyltransferase